MPAYPKSEQARKKRGSRKPSRTEELAIYHEVTEAARNAEGYIVCHDCGQPQMDDQINRHHIKSRGMASGGGKTEASNLVCLCLACHGKRHGRSHI